MMPDNIFLQLQSLHIIIIYVIIIVVTIVVILILRIFKYRIIIVFTEQNSLHRHTSVHERFLDLQEHLCVVQLVLHLHLSTTMMPFGAGRTSVVLCFQLHLCRIHSVLDP